MNINVGNLDRIIRITAGLVILALGLFYGSWWGLVGLLPLMTGTARRCPVYVPFGLSTCKVEEAKE